MCQGNACTNREQLLCILSMTFDTWCKYKNFIKIEIILQITEASTTVPFSISSVAKHTLGALSTTYNIQYIVSNITPLQNTTSTVLSTIVHSIQ